MQTKTEQTVNCTTGEIEPIPQAGDSWTHVGVDSGNLLVVDPCYLENFLNTKGKAWIESIQKAIQGPRSRYRDRVVSDHCAGHPRQICALLHVGDDGNYLVESLTGEIKIEFAD